MLIFGAGQFFVVGCLVHYRCLAASLASIHRYRQHFLPFFLPASCDNPKALQTLPNVSWGAKWPLIANPWSRCMRDENNHLHALVLNSFSPCIFGNCFSILHSALQSILQTSIRLFAFRDVLYLLLKACVEFLRDTLSQLWFLFSQFLPIFYTATRVNLDVMPDHISTLQNPSVATTSLRVMVKSLQFLVGPVGSGLPLSSYSASLQPSHWLLGCSLAMPYAPSHPELWCLSCCYVGNIFPSELLTPWLSHLLIPDQMRGLYQHILHVLCPHPALFFSKTHVTMWHRACLFSASLSWKVSIEGRHRLLLRVCPCACHIDSEGS